MFLLFHEKTKRGKRRGGGESRGDELQIPLDSDVRNSKRQEKQDLHQKYGRSVVKNFTRTDMQKKAILFNDERLKTHKRKGMDKK